MKKQEAWQEIKNLPKGELRGKAHAISEELMKLRFRGGAGQVEQSHRIGELKKNLARVYSLMGKT